MEQLILCIFIIYRGRHWEGITIYNATDVYLWQNVWIMIEKCIFNTDDSLKQEFIF